LLHISSETLKNDETSLQIEGSKQVKSLDMAKIKSNTEERIKQITQRNVIKATKSALDQISKVKIESEVKELIVNVKA
jgi:hypothetical protein